MLRHTKEKVSPEESCSLFPRLPSEPPKLSSIWKSTEAIDVDVRALSPDLYIRQAPLIKDVAISNTVTVLLGAMQESEKTMNILFYEWIPNPSKPLLWDKKKKKSVH